MKDFHVKVYDCEYTPSKKYNNILKKFNGKFSPSTKTTRKSAIKVHAVQDVYFYEYKGWWQKSLWSKCVYQSSYQPSWIETYIQGKKGWSQIFHFWHEKCIWYQPSKTLFTKGLMLGGPMFLWEFPHQSGNAIKQLPPKRYFEWVYDILWKYTWRATRDLAIKHFMHRIRNHPFSL